jgi:hypothetical protein
VACTVPPGDPVPDDPVADDPLLEDPVLEDPVLEDPVPGDAEPDVPDDPADARPEPLLADPLLAEPLPAEVPLLADPLLAEPLPAEVPLCVAPGSVAAMAPVASTLATPTPAVTTDSRFMPRRRSAAGDTGRPAGLLGIGHPLSSPPGRVTFVLPELCRRERRVSSCEVLNWL